MDSDATTLQNAVDLLRQHYGEQLTGPRLAAEAQLRHTLERDMGLDTLAADRVLKRLCLSGQLVYVDSADSATQTGTARDADSDTDTRTTATGPVISMPLTQSADGGQPLISSASPAMLMGISNDQAGEVERPQDTNPDPDGDTVGWLLAPVVDEVMAPEASGDNDAGDGDRGGGGGGDGDGGGRRPQGYWRIGQVNRSAAT